VISTQRVETVVKTGEDLSFLLRIGNDSNGLMATILTEMGHFNCISCFGADWAYTSCQCSRQIKSGRVFWCKGDIAWGAAPDVSHL